MEGVEMTAVESLYRRGTGVFWGEMAPCDHLCQIYGDDEAFLDALEGYVAGGLRSGESVIVIATAPHLESLETRLVMLGVDIDAARSEDRFIALNAEATLDRFMVNGWPEDQRFADTVSGVIARARGDGRKVRAFGEMVAVLWARGHYAATVRLEHLWNKLLKSEQFPLFCAYPKAGFTKGASESITELQLAHSKVIAA
jgi:hypothetical protein